MNLAKTYQPNEYEPNIYALWEQAGAFRPSGKGKPFSLMMPPPNANANLHMGHALDMDLKDILARYRRMKGDDVVFIPGADHAGFETWVVYERKLTAEGKSRFDYSREQLYSNVWDFVEQNRGNMELQIRALGASADWQHGVFTLDSKVVEVVYQTFQKLWDEGLIYRGKRIVNYCTTHQTSFADIEVQHRDEKGKLWQIAYPMLDHVGELVIATTRPETMLGDVAVAVHPDDERYKHLVGSKVLLPLVDREIPIIADEYVDPEFGTGAVKITPAHDPNDFEVAARHNLEAITVIDDDGKMINVPAEFNGLTIEEAREKVLKMLEVEELRRGEEEIEHAVGHCYKCGTVIQPLLKDQWFIKVQPLAEQAIKVLQQGDIATYPSGKVAELIAYLGQLRDWNISRQIPWGIPIPAFRNPDDNADWVFDTRVSEKSIEVDGKTYVRDEDTFDTWFSSGQWPYIITDFLKHGDYARFFPITLLETGSDLLRQWVARMVMLSVYRTGQVPFREVYFHGMVNDEHNQKMSKSKGNVINPMDVIAEYGSDALRLGVIAGRSAAQSQAFNRGAVIAGRNFCNKLWNIARFIADKVSLEDTKKPAEPVSLADHWMLSRLDATRKSVEQLLDDYRFAEAADAVYHAAWDDLADWYIEAAKTEDNAPLLAEILDTVLKLVHPFAPFVTETIWQSLDWHAADDDMLITAAWPTVLEFNEISAANFDNLRSVVSEARFVASELPGNRKYTLLYQDDTLVADNADLIKRLARLEAVEHVSQARGLRLAGSGRDVWLDVDADTLYDHQSNLEARLAEVKTRAAALEGRLGNEAYVAKAPAKLVEETRAELADLTMHIEQLMRELDVLAN